MGKCVKCGKSAGLGSTEHQWDCLYVAPELTPEQRFVKQLEPVLIKAAVRGGVAGAFTLVGIGFVIAFIVFVVRLLG